MSDTARDKAEAAMVAAFEREIPCHCHEAYKSRGLVDPTCTYHDVCGLFDALLDAVPDQVLADLLIERGALTQTDVGGYGANHPYYPLYRLTPHPEAGG